MPNFYGDIPGHQIAPIEITNSKGKKSSSMNRAKAGKPKTTFSSGPSFKARTVGKRPPTGVQKRAAPAIPRERAAQGWDNSNTTDSKYFDKNIDRDYLRKQRTS